MDGVFLNEDCNHFLFTRASEGFDKITIEDNIEFIDQYKDTGITDFLINLSTSVTFFKSERNQSIYDIYKQIQKNGDLYDEYKRTKNVMLKSWKLFCDMYDSGFDYRKIWIDRLREIGIHPWASIRMNDIHECSDEKSILLGDFYNGNRDKTVGVHKGKLMDYYDYALDYTYSDVRMQYLSIISEVLDTYDVDGLELDFMREIYSFARGREYKGKEIMNEFVHMVASLVWQAERERKHRIKLAVRVPSSIEMSMRLGYDVNEWISSGWIDHVTISPRWATSDGDMNVELWRSLLKTTPVTLGCGIEILCNGLRKQRGPVNTKETVYGYSKAYSDLGADYIYLFNYMDGLNVKDTDSVFEKNNYNEMLKTIGDAEALKKCKRRHIVTYNDVSCVGYSVKHYLPIITGDGEVKTFRILTGSTKGRKIKMLIGCTEKVLPSDIQLWLNTKQCYLSLEDNLIKLPAPQDLYYYSAEISSENEEYVFVGEISSESEITIEWIEMDIE